MKARESIVCGKFVVESNRFYSVAELATGLEIAPKTVRILLANKDFRGRKPGRHHRVSGLSVIRYFESCDSRTKKA